MLTILRRSRIALWLLVAAFCASAQGGGQPSSGRWAQKQFLITFWCPPPATDEALSRVAAEGFNLTWTPVEGLDVAQRHGLRAMLTSDLLTPAILDDDAKMKKLDELIDRVKNHPAMEAYYLTDEPGAGAFPGLGRLVDHLRRRDPAHLAYINLFPTYANEQQLGVSANDAERARVSYPTNFAGVGTDDKTVLRYREHLKQFVEVVKPDLISYDHYHFLKLDSLGNPVDGKQYFLNLGLIRLAAIEAGKPFLNIIQADTIEKSWRLPNATELRFLVFTTLAYGGRGISYFTYWGPEAYNGLYIDGKPAPLLGPVVDLNKEIKTFGAELMKLESQGVYHTGFLPYGTEPIPLSSPIKILSPGEFVVGLFGKAGRPAAFMIVNRDYQHQAVASVKVGLSGSNLQEFDRKTGKWVPTPKLGVDRKMDVVLGPGDGRMFRAGNSPGQLRSPKLSSGRE